MLTEERRLEFLEIVEREGELPLELVQEAFPDRSIADIMGRHGVVSISYQAVAGGLRFKDVLDHPDVPDDAIPVQLLPVIDITCRILLVSPSWPTCPEPGRLRHLRLAWTRSPEGGVKGVSGGEGSQFETASNEVL